MSKNSLGTNPKQLGQKESIDTCIVSVRASCAIEPGQKCILNKDREAVPNGKGFGIADPYHKGTILRNESSWMLLVNDDGSIDFSAPTVEPKFNQTIKSAADYFGVTYDQIMEAAQYVVDHDEPAPYPGTKELSELDEDEDFWNDECYDFWSEWGEEVNYEFENMGTECCPEYAHPECSLFAGK